MITLEDCTAFCDASENDVARIARERKLTMAVAIACAHAHHLAHAERKRHASQRGRSPVNTADRKLGTSGLLPA